MRLFLCEKPSQGRDIAKVLGATRRGDGCWLGSNLTVTWCIGHLLETAPPDAYDARYPDYPRGITVPAMVEVSSGKVVTNDFPWITHDFFFEWKDHKKIDIMGFRNNAYKSVITGTMAPVHHTPWKDALEDSMESYLRN